ncbi:MAG: DUF1080 domain-containing protein [Planctomycetaceae bacterium]
MVAVCLLSAQVVAQPAPTGTPQPIPEAKDPASTETPPATDPTPSGETPLGTTGTGDAPKPETPVTGNQTTDTPSTTPPTPATVPEVVPPAPKVNLLASGKLADEDWVFFSSKKESPPSETWNVIQAEGKPVLVCNGKPHGYVRTKQSFANFEMGLEWKYPSDESGNSGILLFTTGEEHIWPTAIQVQLHQPTVGSIFGSEGGKVETEVRTMNHFSRPVNQWNEMHIVSQQGMVTVTINGKEVGTVKVLTPKMGTVGLQSEGSEIHFRNVWIRKLSDTAASPATGTDPAGSTPAAPTTPATPATPPVTPPSTGPPSSSTGATPSEVSSRSLPLRRMGLVPVIRNRSTIDCFAPTLTFSNSYFNSAAFACHRSEFAKFPLGTSTREQEPISDLNHRLMRKQERRQDVDADRESLAITDCFAPEFRAAHGRRHRETDCGLLSCGGDVSGHRRSRLRD